jgi:alkylation response protein AidB-like acyl-CoA dehydrogenase
VTDPDRYPIVRTTRQFVEEEVKPVARALDHADRYPHGLVERMRGLGLFGCLVAPEHGDSGFRSACTRG